MHANVINGLRNFSKMCWRKRRALALGHDTMYGLGGFVNIAKATSVAIMCIRWLNIFMWTFEMSMRFSFFYAACFSCTLIIFLAFWSANYRFDGCREKSVSNKKRNTQLYKLLRDTDDSKADNVRTLRVLEISTMCTYIGVGLLLLLTSIIYAFIQRLKTRKFNLVMWNALFFLPIYVETKWNAHSKTV